MTGPTTPAIAPVAAAENARPAIRVPWQAARATALRALVLEGVPEPHAALQVDLLIGADLAGLASHGLLRLPRIIERIRNGVADPQAVGRHDWRGDSFLAVDGERGLGPVVVQHALDAALPAVRRSGACVVAIRNNNHIGRLAHYVEPLAANGLAVIGMSTSEALVHPWGGRRAMLGTNPIAIGVPADPHPFVVDLATSAVAMGKIHDYANRGAPLEEGWALDGEGRPTTDAVAAKAGAIAPFGGPKGYALGLGIEVLVTALTGAAIGGNIAGTLDSSEVCNKGDVFVLATPGSNVDIVSNYLDEIRGSPPMEGAERIDVPGDRARRTVDDNRARGLLLAATVWARIGALAASRGGVA